MSTTGIAVMIMSVVFTIAFWFSVYFCIYRNNKVYRLRDEIIDMCYEYDKRHINQSSYVSAYKWFFDKYTYKQMIYSFKPLRLECCAHRERV